MMLPRSVRSVFSLLIACLTVTITSAQTDPQLKVFRGTLVHSRVRTEMEVLQDHLIGFDENNFGRMRAISNEQKVEGSHVNVGVGSMKDEEIAFVRPASELESLAQQWSFNQNDVVTLTDSQFLMPGLVDCHFHPAMYFRAGADHPSFASLILDSFIPGDAMFRNTTYAREESMRIVRHTLRFGATTVSYLGPTGVNGTIELARVINDLGQRVIVKVSSFDTIPAPFAGLFQQSVLPQSTEEALSGARRFIELIRELENPLIQPGIGPALASLSSPELVQGLGAIINATGVFVQFHFAEQVAEVNTTLPEWEEVGLLPVNRTILAHSIHISEGEMESYRRRGLSIAHCPNSNLNLNSGILDARRMLNFGINVCLGTDIAGGYSPSVLNEMRTALHVSRALSLNLTMNLPADYTPLTLAEGFYMATMGGAEATGLGDTVGNFEVGKQFDALLIDTSAPSPSGPVFDTSSSDTTNVRIQKFLYLGDDRNMLKVFVAGREIVQDTPTNSAPPTSHLSLTMGVVLLAAAKLLM